MFKGIDIPFYIGVAYGIELLVAYFNISTFSWFILNSFAVGTAGGSTDYLTRRWRGFSKKVALAEFIKGYVLATVASILIILPGVEIFSPALFAFVRGLFSNLWSGLAEGAWPLGGHRITKIFTLKGSRIPKSVLINEKRINLKNIETALHQNMYKEFLVKLKGQDMGEIVKRVEKNMDILIPGKMETVEERVQFISDAADMLADIEGIEVGKVRERPASFKTSSTNLLAA